MSLSWSCLSFRCEAYVTAVFSKARTFQLISIQAMIDLGLACKNKHVGINTSVILFRPPYPIFRLATLSCTKSLKETKYTRNAPCHTWTIFFLEPDNSAVNLEKQHHRYFRHSKQTLLTSGTSRHQHDEDPNYNSLPTETYPRPTKIL